MPRAGKGSAVGFVTKGTYNREACDEGAFTLTAGTEKEVANVAVYIHATAAGGDQLYSWIRGCFFVWADTGMLYEWALVKGLIGAAVPNLNDSDTVEKLHKDGKLFARGIDMSPIKETGRLKPIKFELYNVILQDGEELMMIVNPWCTSGANNARIMGLLEWRQVGV